MGKSGMSLLEVLISLSLISFVAFGISGMVTNVNHSVEALEEKLLLIELQKNLSSIFSNYNLCAKEVADRPGGILVDKATLDSASIELTSLYHESVGSNVFVKKGMPVSSKKFPIVKRIFIDQVRLVENKYFAFLTIEFQTSSVSRKPIVQPIDITLIEAKNPNNLAFVGCSVTAPSGGNKIGPSEWDQATCQSSGGEWIIPGDADRSPFCAFPNSIIVWY